MTPCSPPAWARSSAALNFGSRKKASAHGVVQARGQAVAVSRAASWGARPWPSPRPATPGAWRPTRRTGAAGLRLHAGGRPGKQQGRVRPVRRPSISGAGTDQRLWAPREGVAAHGWFDVSTLREPYRQEDKKTMGYELAEQLNWMLPDALIYPTGGGHRGRRHGRPSRRWEQLGWIGPTGRR